VKLIGDLCELTKFEATISRLDAIVRLDSKHPIFFGHFPGHPVMPGVIQMQLVSELVGHHLRKRICLIELDRCKFIKVLDPEKTPGLVFCIELQHERDHILMKATGETSEGVFLKLEGRYENKLGLG
jgi:3-hydroxyacyl-[acyl-carrier-protein] dehydratase